MRDCPHTQRGAALILTLAAVLIISILLSGALLLSVSHFSLSHTNSDYASALYLAEAGIDWELNRITQSVAAADQTRTAAQPLGPGTFQVQVAPVAGSTWDPGQPFWVVSTGTVDGVSRTVRVQCKGVTLFGLYALFGINQLNVGGNFTVDGAVGTDGLVATNGNPNFNGNFWYCGSASGDDVTPLVGDGYSVYNTPLPQEYPTVNEVATLRAQEHWGATGPQTVDFFKTHNNNTLLHTTTGASVPITNYTLNNATFQGIADGTIWFPPGDYYFESLDLPANNIIKIDNGAGLVNIWLGPDGGGGRNSDAINGTMLFTSTDSAFFRIYEGSARTLKMNGTSDFYGSILAYNGPDKNGNYYGSVQFNGTMNIWGSVIAYNVVKSTGNGTITFHSGGGSGSADDPTLYYGAAKGWEEVGPA